MCLRKIVWKHHNGEHLALAHLSYTFSSCSDALLLLVPRLHEMIKTLNPGSLDTQISSLLTNYCIQK